MEETIRNAYRLKRPCTLLGWRKLKSVQLRIIERVILRDPVAREIWLKRWPNLKMSDYDYSRRFRHPANQWTPTHFKGTANSIEETLQVFFAASTIHLLSDSMIYSNFGSCAPVFFTEFELRILLKRKSMMTREMHATGWRYSFTSIDYESAVCIVWPNLNLLHFSS